MDTPYIYGNPIIFRTPIWVSLLSDPDAAVLLKPLSYGDIAKANDTVQMTSKDPTLFKYDTPQTILPNHILDTKNIIGFDNHIILMAQLPQKDVIHLYTKLIEISIISVEQLDQLSDMINIQYHPQLKDESWNCKQCQAKGLDYGRACGFLDKEKRDPKPHLPRINGKRFTTCPISTIDPTVLNIAAQAHNLYSSGFLPETGGIAEQTDWFVRVAQLYKRKLADIEREAYEARK